MTEATNCMLYQLCKVKTEAKEASSPCISQQSRALYQLGVMQPQYTVFINTALIEYCMLLGTALTQLLR